VTDSELILRRRRRRRRRSFSYQLLRLFQSYYSRCL